MRIAILARGKRPDRTIGDLCDEYATRSRRFIPFEVVPCPTARAQWERARGFGGPVVVLDERGTLPTSPELATMLGGWRDAGHRTLACLVGDADGFDDGERSAADALLSLSRLTLPHRLALVVLCEQLYRAGTILGGHPYHHG